jgi:hypothetical protein
MATATKSPQVLELPEPSIEIVRLRIVGDSELITHAWSEKARAMMRGKQTGAAQQGREPKNPEQEYQGAFYRLLGGAPAMPTIAFKNSAVTAVTQINGLTKVAARGMFHTVGELVEIEGNPYMREDMVRVGMGTADIRYRPGFPEWAVTLTVRYNTRAMTLQQLVHLFNQAGFSTGVGEWRPERDGSFGMFHVEAVDEVEAPV